ncbi:hypothetical protein HNQ80_003817 [Anaerosolibacter carboniphilus]|uniref:Spore coat associated protein JA (CotJA) n=1 Tax=Anaerosolibacter carboniphilus TaxID=1417629 RepID=A0A841KVL6_9FIRM|nr:spore coat associated protein CotJA [Anaerosolibacter carboniphilus]MBB6217694.1 hypothetical protein [Anaerosolibacter carboniphilus]
MKYLDQTYEHHPVPAEIEQLRYMLARAYVPYQMYMLKYPLPMALQVGTLFPELVKPWPPYYYDEDYKG